MIRGHRGRKGSAGESIGIFIFVIVVICGLIFIFDKIIYYAYHQKPGSPVSRLTFGKLTAEEAGYTKSMQSHMDSVCSHAFEIGNAFRESERLEAMGDERGRDTAVKAAQSALGELRKAAASISVLEKTLPPESMQHIHDQIIKVLTLSTGAESARQLSQDCHTLLVMSHAFRKDVEKRSYIQFPKKLIMSYSTPGTVGVGIEASKEGFFLTSISVSTSIGELAWSQEEPSGVTMIHMQHKGLVRHFSTDRPFIFEIYLPAGNKHKLTVNGIKEGEVTFEIIDIP
jgi:hypothetical protein